MRLIVADFMFIVSFRCVCGRGYKPAGEVCADVDECSVRPPPCEHLCKNTDGMYYYTLSFITRNCLTAVQCILGCTE